MRVTQEVNQNGLFTVEAMVVSGVDTGVTIGSFATLEVGLAAAISYLELQTAGAATPYVPFFAISGTVINAEASNQIGNSAGDFASQVFQNDDYQMIRDFFVDLFDSGTTDANLEIIPEPDESGITTTENFIILEENNHIPQAVIDNGWVNAQGAVDWEGFATSHPENSDIPAAQFQSANGQTFIPIPKDKPLILTTPETAESLAMGELSASDAMFIEIPSNVGVDLTQPSVIDVFASPDAIVVDKGSLPDGTQYITQLHGNGTVTTISAVELTDGSFSNVVVESIDTQTGVAITQSYDSADSNGVLTDTIPEVAAADHKGVAYPNFAATFGSQLGVMLAGDSLFETMGGATVGNIIGQTVGSVIEDLGDSLLSLADTGELTWLGTATDEALEAIPKLFCIFVIDRNRNFVRV